MPNSPEQTKFEAFKETLWNPRNKTCLGRTGGSWAKLIAFYIVFYSCLAAIWTIFFYIFQTTISDKQPKWQLEESLIGTNPGLGFRPKLPAHRVDSALITYTVGTESEFLDHWVSDLNEYISPFQNKSVNEKQSCEQGNNDYNYCPFDTSVLPPECTSAQNYSFYIGKPCILIKLNRIYNWKPEPHEEKPASYPSDAPFSANAIQITCDGQYDEDKEHIGPVDYFPNGIQSKYYPFLNQPGYQSPFVMVQFKNPKLNTLIHVECKAWAKNIHQDRHTQSGIIIFELFIERNLTLSQQSES